jgi:hypothetical protein
MNAGMPERPDPYYLLEAKGQLPDDAAWIQVTELARELQLADESVGVFRRAHCEHPGCNERIVSRTCAAGHVTEL